MSLGSSSPIPPVVASFPSIPGTMVHSEAVKHGRRCRWQAASVDNGFGVSHLSMESVPQPLYISVIVLSPTAAISSLVADGF